MLVVAFGCAARPWAVTGALDEFDALAVEAVVVPGMTADRRDWSLVRSWLPRSA